MITDDELADLPEDPELAFVKFEEILRARLYQQEERAANEERSAISYRIEYMNKIFVAAQVYLIKGAGNWQLPSVGTDVTEVYAEFMSNVDRATMEIRLLNAPRNRQNSVGLDGNARTKIHHFIAQIRIAINAADLKEEKRDSLFAKLNKLSLEVDKNRTSLEAGMAVYIAICDGIGQGFTKLEIARKWIDSIAGLFGKAKETEEALYKHLPRREQGKQLEAPRAASQVPSWDAADLDGEIPF